METTFKFVVAVLGFALSVRKSRAIAGLSDKFDRFDAYAVRTVFPAGARSQAFYLLYMLSVTVYNFASDYSLSSGSVRPYVLLAWNLLCASPMIPVVRFVAHVRMLRDRYGTANRTFANSEYTRDRSSVVEVGPRPACPAGEPKSLKTPNTYLRYNTGPTGVATPGSRFSPPEAPSTPLE